MFHQYFYSSSFLYYLHSVCFLRALYRVNAHNDLRLHCHRFERIIAVTFPQPNFQFESTIDQRHSLMRYTFSRDVKLRLSGARLFPSASRTFGAVANRKNLERTNHNSKLFPTIPSVTKHYLPGAIVIIFNASALSLHRRGTVFT